MKKTLFLLFLIFSFYFIFFEVSIKGKNIEPKYQYIYDSKIQITDDDCNLVYYVDGNEYLVKLNNCKIGSIKNYNYYWLINENSNLNDSTSMILSMKIEKNKISNEYLLKTLILKDDNLFSVWTKSKQEILNFFQIIYFDSLKNLSEALKTTNILSNNIKSLFLSNNIEKQSTNNDEYIIAERKYGVYKDDSIYSYINRPELCIDSNNIRLDDPIINFIPKEYFFEECEKVEYGEAYGFYIKTIMEGVSHYASYVSIFVYKEQYPTGNYRFSHNIKEEHSDKLFVDFIPLFNLYFSNIKKDKNTEKYYNFGNKSSFVEVDAITRDFGYTDFALSNQIKNLQDKNFGDEGYSIENDGGLFISSISYNISNYENNEYDNYQSEYINQLNAYVSKLKLFDMFLGSSISNSVDIILNIFSSIYNNIENSYQSLELNINSFEHSFGDIATQLSYYGLPVKNATISLNQNDINDENKYYIGRFNYPTSNINIYDKVHFYCCIDYDFNTNKSEIQTSNLIFSTRIYSFDNDVNINKVILFSSTNYFLINLNDNLYYNSASLSLNYGTSRTLSLITDVSEMKIINVYSDSLINIVVYDDFGNQIIDKVLNNASMDIAIYMQSNHNYYIKISAMSSDCNVNYSLSSAIINDIGYNTSVNQFLYSKSCVIFRINITTRKVYFLYTEGNLDTGITIQNNNTILFYNDDSTYIDEEGEENQDINAKLVEVLNVGTYYIILENYTYQEGTTQFYFR